MKLVGIDKRNATERRIGRSVDLQPESFDDRRPESNIGCKRLPEFLGARVERWFNAGVNQHLLVGRFGNDRPRRPRNLLDNPNWVPAGANSPMEPITVMPGKPSSAAVGSSGAAFRRVGLVTARTRILPDRWNSITCPVTPGVPIGTCPLTRSVMRGPVPRYGTCTISGVPASDLNNSPRDAGSSRHRNVHKTACRDWLSRRR